MPIELQRSLWFDDPLEGVGLGRGEAVKTFESDENLVGAGVGEAQVAKGHTRGGISDGSDFRRRSLVRSKDFQIAVIGVETAVSASGDFLEHLDLFQLGIDAAMVVGVSSVASERAAMDVIGCALICSWMRKHEGAERPIWNALNLDFGTP